MTTWMITGAASGIGQALAAELAERRSDVNLVLTARNENSLDRCLAALPSQRAARGMSLDLSDENCCQRAAAQLNQEGIVLDGIINAAGFLHGAGFRPEKRIEDFSLALLQANITANAGALAMLAKHFYPLLPRQSRAVLASLSARVGSISDNRLGGWTSYRASKAAHNMIVRNLAIEFGRRYKQLIVVGLHPGTVDTDLSRPFQRGVDADSLFTPAQAAGYLLNVIDGLTVEASGRVFDWAGKEVPP